MQEEEGSYISEGEVLQEEGMLEQLDDELAREAQAKLNSITIRLDVRSKYDGGKLDESIEAEQIVGINLVYFNRGEGEKWEASVPFTVVAIEK